MGSLVPGWETDSLDVPRGMKDVDESSEEPKGYFARLTSHRTSVGSQAAAPLDVPVNPSRTALGRTSSPAVFKSASLPRSDGHGGAESQRKYQLTDWAHELSSLKGSKFAAQPKDIHGDQHGHDVGSLDRHTGPWWRALEVGHLNERPTEGESRQLHVASSFTPQMPLLKKLDLEGEHKAQEQ